MRISKQLRTIEADAEGEDVNRKIVDGCDRTIRLKTWHVCITNGVEDRTNGVQPIGLA